jgi:hypothetical protein
MNSRQAGGRQCLRYHTYNYQCMLLINQARGRQCDGRGGTGFARTRNGRTARVRAFLNNNNNNNHNYYYYYCYKEWTDSPSARLFK